LITELSIRSAFWRSWSDESDQTFGTTAGFTVDLLKNVGKRRRWTFSKVCDSSSLMPAAKNKKKAGRGGARPGSGRKRINGIRKPITAKFKPELFEWIKAEAAARGVSPSSFVEKAVEYARPHVVRSIPQKDP
jgi:hypothetical protein